MREVGVLHAWLLANCAFADVSEESLRERVGGDSEESLCCEVQSTDK